MKGTWGCPTRQQSARALSRPVLLTCSGLREMDAATACKSPRLLFGEGHADLSVDSKKDSISSQIPICCLFL